MATTPLVNVTLSSVPPKITGTGSGLITTFMYFANSLGVALIGILFSASLKHSLLEADLADYVRAFSFSLAAIGGLAFTGFLCLCFAGAEIIEEVSCFLRCEQSNKERPS